MRWTMKYSAVEKVEPIVSENDGVVFEVKQKKSAKNKISGEKFHFKKPNNIKGKIADTALVLLCLGIIVSLGVLVTSVVKNMMPAESLVNSVGSFLGVIGL